MNTAWKRLAWAICLVTSTSAFANDYMCEDARGVRSWSKTPCASGLKLVEVLPAHVSSPGARAQPLTGNCKSIDDDISRLEAGIQQLTGSNRMRSNYEQQKVAKQKAELDPLIARLHQECGVVRTVKVY